MKADTIESWIRQHNLSGLFVTQTWFFYIAFRTGVCKCSREFHAFLCGVLRSYVMRSSET